MFKIVLLFEYRVILLVQFVNRRSYSHGVRSVRVAEDAGVIGVP